MPSDYRPGLMAQSARIAPLVEEGRVIGTITVIEDVTERVGRENALRESEEWLNTTLRSIGDAVIATDTEGLVTLMNPVAEDLTGWNEEEAMGRPLGDVFNIVNEHTEEPAKNPVTRALREGIVVGLANHTVLIAKDATRRVIADSAAPIRDPAGNIIGVVMVFRDITERVRAQEALQKYSERLEEMVEERTTELQEAQERLVRREKLAIMGQLAGGVAHEIRNPLSGISNAVYYLKTVLPDASENVKEYLEIITELVCQSDRIISDLLDFSRTKVPDRRKVTVSELVARMLEKRPPPENVEVTTEIPSDLPSVCVDPYQVGQVLGNLVTNAYQAITSSSSGKTPEGGNLTIIAQAEEDQVAISVTDTGVGISQDNMAKLFEPLFTTKAKGLGLGLMVVKTLVEANEGSIEVTSGVGKGSTFTVRLPLGGEEREA